MWPFLWLEDEPPADLNAPWLEDVAIACRDAKIHIVDVDVWQCEAPAIEKIKKLSTYFKVRRFSDLSLLHETEILREERLRSQTSVSWRGVAEESQRIGVVCDISWIHCDIVEREGRCIAEIGWS